MAMSTSFLRGWRKGRSVSVDLLVSAIQEGEASNAFTSFGKGELMSVLWFLAVVLSGVAVVAFTVKAVVALLINLFLGALLWGSLAAVSLWAFVSLIK